MNIIKVTKSTLIHDEDYNPSLVFQDVGCSCCSEEILITPENLEKARREAREWLKYLETLEPVIYPPESIWK